MAPLPIIAGGLVWLVLQSGAPPAPLPLPHTCPRVAVVYQPGLVPDFSAAGVVAAVWDSGAIVRAESPDRPGGAHVVGSIAPSAAMALVETVKDSVVWRGEAALAPDVPTHFVLLVRHDGSRVGRSVMSNTTHGTAVADLIRRLFALPLQSSRRVTDRVDEARWRCPATNWR